MEDIKVCRICLVRDVKMHNMQSHPLYSYFEPVSGNKHLTIVNIQSYACYECAELLKKFYAFRQKCLQSHGILSGLLDNTGKIQLSELNKLDRDSLRLSSTLSVSGTEKITICHVKEENNEIETENIDRPKFNQDIVHIKEEYNYLSPKRVDSSDDEEPLCLHKKNKSTDTENTEVAIKIEESEVDVIPATEQSESIQVAKISVLPVSKKRSRAKKNTKKVRKAKSTADSSKKHSADDLQNDITIITLTVEQQIEEINKRKESSNYLKSPYQCHLCYKGFVNTDAWKHHVDQHSASAGDLECPICKIRFKTKQTLHKHTSHHEKKFACKSCPYVSTNMNQAKQHQARHKGVTFKCKYCDDVFTVLTSYMSHIRIKHPSRFICGICGCSYVSELGLTLHKTRMHKEVMVKGEQLNEDGPYCEECDVKFVSTEAYDRHMTALHQRKESKRTRGTKNETNEKKRPVMTFPAKCEHCSEVISHRNGLWWHYRRMHPNKKYPRHVQKNHMCDICGKSFMCNAFLVYHKRTHTDERAYKCSKCGKAFYNRTNLYVHEKIHNDSRPWRCSVCVKAFKCKGALDRHLRCHTGQKPFECEVCGKAFTQSNSVKLHITTVHLKQPAPYISRKRKANINKTAPPQQFAY